MIRAMFKLVAKTVYDHNQYSTLRFECRYDCRIPEHQRFYEATPFGQVEMMVNNPAALEEFQIGQDYYADFSLVKPAE